jgi:hypothetical protein
MEAAMRVLFFALLLSVFVAADVSAQDCPGGICPAPAIRVRAGSSQQTSMSKAIKTTTRQTSTETRQIGRGGIIRKVLAAVVAIVRK